MAARRLAAILAADIAGYSSLMGADEDATIKDLKGHQSIVLPMISDYDGRVIDTAGDGFLAEFASVLNAVRCALAVQKTMAERNANVEQGRAMQFRIGVNQGDLVADDAHIYGDGINVAARLEGIAEPGGICISGKVFDEVRDRLPAVFVNHGEQRLRNIARPVRVYHVLPNPVEGKAIAPPTRPDLPLAARSSVAVLPLINMTGIEDLNGFCDGFCDALAASLSRFRELLVVARRSSFNFQPAPPLAAQIGPEVGVRYVLESGLVRIGTLIRMNVKLIDVHSSFHVWGEPFEGQLDDILAFEREATRRIVCLLPAYIESAEKIRVRRLELVDLEPFGYLLRGIELCEEYTREGHARAAEMYQKAVEFDPTFARAYAALSRVRNHQHRYRWTDDPEASLNASLELARTAVRLDPADPKGLAELGQVYLFMKNVEAAVSSYRRALALNPNDPDVMAYLAEALVSARQPDEALALINEAIDRSPFPADEYLWFKADALFALERYAEVIATARLMRNPSEAERLVTASYALSGAIEEARAHAALVLQKHPEFRISCWIKAQPDSEGPDCQRLACGLSLAGLPE